MGFLRTAWLTIAGMALAATFNPGAHAALTVHLDFTTDIRNGAGAAGSNGIADWVDNLDALASTAGISAFTGVERALIEAGIKSQLETMYGAYNVTFNTFGAGSHERINFGAFDPSPGALGLAPLDFMNFFSHSGSEGSSARVFTRNFHFIVESAEPRATIINELTTALAGTGAHELGHTVGVNHHHAYGNPAISPANYADTGGIQNTHIMATGTTGLDEDGRESNRTFSQWSNLMLEAAGGGNPVLRGVMTGTSLATNVLPESDSFGGPDVGDTPATAKSLTLTFMPISGLNAANTVSTLDGNNDIDVFKFDVLGPSRILADIWSNNLYLNSFDSILRLFDTDGTTVLAFNDDTTYFGNAYNNGTFQGFDSNLLNVTLPTAGTYFLEVSSFGNLDGTPGGTYNLIFGVAAIPEARAWLMLGLVFASAGLVHGARGYVIGRPR